MFSKKQLIVSLTAGLATAGLFAGSANAEEEAHSDIMPYVDNGVLLTGGYVFAEGTAEAGPFTVYEGELGANYEAEGMPGGDEPGFATDGSSTIVSDGTIDFAFPANTALNFNSLLLPGLNLDAAYWDGTLGGNFVATPDTVILTNELISVDLNGDSTLPGTTGFTIWTSDSNGVGHGHFDVFIDEPDATAQAGIYLISLELEAGSGGPTSDPLFFVLNYGLDEELHEVAADFVSAGDLTAAVPEPASLALVLGGGLVALGRRRRA
ncbi:PEP-CTERM sorting domain-containing protein [Algisphaera agarilytica]|uniref:PEP-CTERM protein-sorting domain-containing protein n=1 Tax=Algisphaera agarilytica TaxID=1385975 RepID=A0A7X0LLE3_9BACT|nr:PEP-CTERM sorting domain-containing protein [Algisphaera agarilytica]MBB6429888.1 hypothetical protein [Algisphaera agarilytica]